MIPYQVTWGDSEIVRTVGQLDILLDRLHKEAIDSKPMLVSIEGPAGMLIIGLGHTQGYLTFVLPDSDPPYLVSRSKTNEETEVDFFMDGHHSPCAAKHLVPMTVARKAARVFVEHGALLCDVRWAEV